MPLADLFADEDEEQGLAGIFAASKPQRGFMGNVAESFRRGGGHIQNDVDAHNAIYWGEGDFAGVSERRRQMQLAEAADPIKGDGWYDPRGLVYGAARVAPGMLRGIWEGKEEAAAGAGAAAGAMAIGGAAIPFPEEVVTVPGAALWGAGKGLKVGMAHFWWKQGSGEMLLEMADAGVDPEKAKWIAAAAAVPYALIEFAQVSQLAPAAKEGVRQAAKSTAREALKWGVKQYGKTLLWESLEEVAQRGVSMFAVEAAKASQGLGNDWSVKAWRERGDDLLTTFTSSLHDMALLPLPGSAIDTIAALPKTPSRKQFADAAGDAIEARTREGRRQVVEAAQRRKEQADAAPAQEAEAEAARPSTEAPPVAAAQKQPWEMTREEFEAPKHTLRQPRPGEGMLEYFGDVLTGDPDTIKALHSDTASTTHAYRGMSQAELRDVADKGEIKSLGDLNIGDTQKGKTSYGDNPSQALSYAGNFAHKDYKPTPSRPGYVVEVRKQAGMEYNAQRELEIAAGVPASEITRVWEVRPKDADPNSNKGYIYTDVTANWESRANERLHSRPHREAVQQALAAGKQVPAEVLADYPNLQPQAPAEAAPPAQPPAPPADIPPTPGAAAPGGKPIGRPELANPAVPQPVRDRVDVVDQQRADAGEPEPQSRQVVAQQADERVAADAQGEGARLIAMAQAKQPPGPVDIAIAERLIGQGLGAVLSGDEAGLKALDQLITARRELGTEWGRTGSEMHDPVMGPADRIKYALTRALMERPEGVALADWAKEIEKLKGALKARGLDLDLLDTADPVAAAEMLRAVRDARPSDAPIPDILYEWWLNAILSAPTTQGANIIGNTGHTAWHYIVERPIEALVNLVAQREGGAQVGEFKHMLKGFLPGIMRGARNFLITWKTGMPWMEVEQGVKGRGKVEDASGAISGRAGSIIRWPTRLLQAADQFAKSSIVEWEIGAQAYRIAKAEGLDGEAMTQRMADLREDTNSEAWARSLDKAYELTFQEKTALTTSMIGLRNVEVGNTGVKPLRYIVPFITTPMGIFRLGARKSPLGILAMPFAIRDAAQASRVADASGKAAHKAAARRAWAKVTQKAAEQVIAWSVVAYFLGSRDPEDPRITGSAEARKAGPRSLAYRTAPPQSIKIGDKWYSYSRIEPFATTLASLIDAVDAWQTGSGTPQALGKAFDSVAGQVRDKTFMSGIGDLVRVFEAESPAEGVTKLLTRHTTSWVPNIIRSGARAAKSTIPERRIWGKGDDANARMWRRMAQGLEVGAVADRPRRDLWGREIQAGAGVGSDFLWKLTIPMRVYDDKVFAGDRIILNWNNQHPDEAWYPQAPSRSIAGLDGKRRSMTDEEYDAYAERAGSLAVELVNQVEWKSPDVPKPYHKLILQRLIRRARQVAAMELRGRWAGETSPTAPGTKQR